MTKQDVADWLRVGEGEKKWEKWTWIYIKLVKMCEAVFYDDQTDIYTHIYIYKILNILLF